MGEGWGEGVEFPLDNALRYGSRPSPGSRPTLRVGSLAALSHEGRGVFAAERLRSLRADA
jgi:hypothetical protein